MNKESRIYIAGHTGMVGSALVRTLHEREYKNILVCSHKELDLTEQADVRLFMEQKQPDYIIIAAALVGGIQANRTRPAEFLYQNLMINANIMDAAHKVGVKKLLVLGSLCIYPRETNQPIKETAFLDGIPEPTNEGYSIGKISSLEMAYMYKRQYGDNFISCMPTNIYGPNDDYSLEGSHVIPALMRRFHEAKKNGTDVVTLWGTGTPLREFLYVDDLADACIFLMENYEGERHINVGTGEEVSIRLLASMVSEVVGYQGRLEYDTEKPDGNPRKLLDSSKIHELGWRHRVALREGLKKTYTWFLEHEER